MIGLIKCSFFSNTVYRAYSCVILGALFARTCLSAGRIRRNVCALLLGGAIAFSVIRYYAGITSIFLSITYFFQYVTPFFVCDYLVRHYGLKKMVQGLLGATVFITVIMDASVFLGLDVDATHYQNLISYFFGNKFMVAYLHMQILGIYGEYLYLKKGCLGERERVKLLVVGVYSIFLCLKVGCSTGIVGNLIVAILLVVPMKKNVIELLSSRKFIMIFLVVTNIALVGSDFLVNVPVFKYFIENVLHESITLTGRYKIYAMLPDLFKEQLLFGYGYNRDIFANLIGYGNAQNGILQYMIDCGLVGTTLFVLNWMNSMKGAQSRQEVSWPLVAAVYGFAICGLVEVCLKLNFIVLLAMIYSTRVLSLADQD
ncbi:MAG: O-antigen ligase family protein [Anaerobutyricum hallii]|nr:O-antigen ligase family protein [Anaerobutyricum hallii]